MAVDVSQLRRGDVVHFTVPGQPLHCAVVLDNDPTRGVTLAASTSEPDPNEQAAKREACVDWTQEDKARLRDWPRDEMRKSYFYGWNVHDPVADDSRITAIVGSLRKRRVDEVIVAYGRWKRANGGQPRNQAGR